ncbi:MAG: glycosyltransferase family 4 protein [Spirulinaceae cyanobacterium SM2_1_0]|nr:glycosyltransferase family 4 protein [Spirulinaceae cyanobacterium SM2_1_0]
MTRLLFLSERYPPDIGGLARSAGRLASAIAQQDFSVDVLVWSRFLQPGEVLADENASLSPKLRVYRVGLYRHWDMSFIQTLNVLEWRHRQQPYTAVWGHYLFPAGFLAVWFAQQQGLPSAVSARGNDVERGAFPPGDFARLQWTLHHATVITAVSDDLARKIQLVSQRSDTQVIQNAVDAQLFTPASDAADRQARRQALGLAADELVLGFSGELREKKGQRFLLPALREVRSQRPAALLIIGAIRPSQENLLQAFALEHPDDAARVLITGHLSEPAAVAAHLQLCDLFLLPSLWEGLPNALLEAIACGCSVIASDAGGIPEVIDSGKTGFLLPRHQLHRLGAAVLEWAALPVAAQQAIARAGRDRVCQTFSLPREQERLQTVLTQLIGDA